MKDNSSFEILTDGEHIRKRFGLYGGSQVLQNETSFVGGGFVQKELVQGLLKIIYEIIDNSVDVYVRTKGQYATKIDIQVSSGRITVKDNGNGFPSEIIDTPEGRKYQMVAAFSHARAGSNFDDATREGAGTNGIGSFLTNVCSTDFKATSSDGAGVVSMHSKLGTLVSEPTYIKTKKPRGTEVSFTPDFEFFGVQELDDNHISEIVNRIKGLSISYPALKFTLNGKVIKSTFGEFFNVEAQETTKLTDKATISFSRSGHGSFSTFSLVNGLTVKTGSHIDYIFNAVSDKLLASVKRKLKIEGLTKTRLKQHLRIHVAMTGFKGLRFDSQTKEKITNSATEVKEAFGGSDLNIDLLVKKIMTNKELLDEISAYSKMKDDLANKKDLDKLAKRKKIKSDKYLPSVGICKRIYVVEGNSAMGGMASVMGRKGNAFYALKGVPMNVMEKNFMTNKELSEVYSIIKSNPGIDVCLASDADPDGDKIFGLFSLFVKTYFPEVIASKKYKRFRTPLVISKKNNVLQDWSYTLEGISNLDTKLDVSYVKGLGSWSKPDLTKVIETDGLDAMTAYIVFNDDKIFIDWFSSEMSRIRKEMILEAKPFDIMRA